jgi:hypothetical protein
MFFIDQRFLDAYLQEDKVQEWLNRFSVGADEEIVYQKWLRQSIPKRAIFEHLYGDLLQCEDSQRVLDVGGGVTSLSVTLAERHRYSLVDILAHEYERRIEDLSALFTSFTFFKGDWATFSPGEYDYVIANDLFPNVDQRLELFLEKMLPCTRELRLSLTISELPRFYTTRRVDADEILTMLTWNSRFLRVVLEPYSSRIVGYDPKIWSQKRNSVFPNGREVCLISLRGELG